ncbi:hypothetical protein C0989_002788 [Termitomyces sp. Mn162]|nr:hypothetical protein C0989_002788 [Termitomyces sp. Mn162]
MSESKIDWRWRGMAATTLALGLGNCMSQQGELGDKKLSLKLQVIVKSEGVVVVLSNSYCSGASIKELELEGLIKVIVLEVKLTDDEGAGGSAVDEDGEDLRQAIKLDVDDKQLCGPQAELWGSLELVDHGLEVLGEG